MLLVEYRNNSSGGHYWMGTAEWDRLADAGWTVFHMRHRAMKLFDTEKEAIDEFESVTTQRVMDEGCGHCGPPHEFVIYYADDPDFHPSQLADPSDVFDWGYVKRYLSSDDFVRRVRVNPWDKE